jgi:four helix bundle protein
MKNNLILTKTFNFSIMIIALYRKLIEKKEFLLSKQLFRSGTGIGSNAEEAVGAVSKREFANKMSISLKEARETRYWLRLLNETKLADVSVNRELEEIEEIINILYKIVKTTYYNLLRPIIVPTTVTVLMLIIIHFFIT